MWLLVFVMVFRGASGRDGVDWRAGRSRSKPWTKGGPAQFGFAASDQPWLPVCKISSCQPPRGRLCPSMLGSTCFFCAKPFWHGLIRFALVLPAVSALGARLAISRTVPLFWSCLRLSVAGLLSVGPGGVEKTCLTNYAFGLNAVKDGTNS